MKQKTPATYSPFGNLNLVKILDEENLNTKLAERVREVNKQTKELIILRNINNLKSSSESEIEPWQYDIIKARLKKKMIENVSIEKNLMIRKLDQFDSSNTLKNKSTSKVLPTNTLRPISKMNPIKNEILIKCNHHAKKTSTLNSTLTSTLTLNNFFLTNPSDQRENKRLSIDFSKLNRFKLKKSRTNKKSLSITEKNENSFKLKLHSNLYLKTISNEGINTFNTIDSNSRSNTNNKNFLTNKSNRTIKSIKFDENLFSNINTINLQYLSRNKNANNNLCFSEESQNNSKKLSFWNNNQHNNLNSDINLNTNLSMRKFEKQKFLKECLKIKVQNQSLNSELKNKFNQPNTNKKIAFKLDSHQTIDTNEFKINNVKKELRPVYNSSRGLYNYIDEDKAKLIRLSDNISKLNETFLMKNKNNIVAMYSDITLTSDVFDQEKLNKFKDPKIVFSEIKENENKLKRQIKGILSINKKFIK